MLVEPHPSSGLQDASSLPIYMQQVSSKPIWVSTHVTGLSTAPTILRGNAQVGSREPREPGTLRQA